ncbi:MAG TPA: mechanosensitive ion channel family protein [Candidatus Avoscillospira avicola]|uniref:Mechanosensitive ion channel family protein n=1 Tax=Candidatus Avoscillospira avicola TaxID=2840706 RepID=A0A9D1DFN6_9FIRM|nr:mechanosensitive ion channel family protein [Candidatus Avoscillospira avicola]
MLTTTLIPDTAEVEKNLSALQKFLDSISLTKIVTALVLLAVCLLMTKLILKGQDKLLGRSKLDKSLHGLTRSFTKILLLFITVMVVAGSLGIDTSSLLAVLSVAGLAASLALQDSLSNLASGINILLTKPFVVGDFVTAGTYSGTVQEIRIAYTQLSTPENQVVMIPNRTVTASVIINYSTQSKRRLDLTVSASYDAPTELVLEALREAAAIPQVLPDEPSMFRLSGYGDSAINYLLRVWTTTADYWDAYFDILERVRTSFEARGIEMTYPHLNVHMAPTETS